MSTNWFKLAQQICLPLPQPEVAEPEHVEGECDQCGEESEANICPRCVRVNARADAMDAKRDMEWERQAEGKR